MRRNGCVRHDWELSPNVYQTATLLLYGGLVVGFFCLFVPLVRDSTLKLVALAVYAAVGACVVILALICTLADPADSNLRKKIKKVKDGWTWNDREDSEVAGEVFYCVLCEVSVDHRSKHCRTCDKCVQGFDHHCKWLNNCIGTHNYRSFFVLLLATFSLLLGQMGVVLTLFAYCFTEEDTMRESIKANLDVALSLNTFIGLSALYLLVLLLTTCLLGELLCFHIILSSRSMTTYDYIIAERQRKEREAAKRLSGAPTGDWGDCCRRRTNKVASQGHTPSPSKKVGINPCALLRVQKPESRDYHASPGCKDPPDCADPAGDCTGPPDVEQGGATGASAQGQRGEGELKMELSALASAKDVPFPEEVEGFSRPPMADLPASWSGNSPEGRRAIGYRQEQQQ